MPLRTLLVVSLVLSLSSAALAQEWTRYRGPNGAGQSEERSIPTQWTEKDYNWRVKLPGLGHGSPVVWGDRIFLLSADPETAERHLLCLSAGDGSTLWRKDFASTPHHLHTRSSYASCTPAVDEERVYFCWGAPEKVTLTALTHAGEPVWEVDLGPFTSMHGFGQSPMLYGDFVVLANLQQGEEKLREDQKPGISSVVALDKKTGELRWKTPRTSSVAAYSVPMLFENAAGEEELIGCCTANGIFSLNPKTGEENWWIDVFTMRTVSSPTAAGGLIFGTTGSGGGGNYVVAIRPPAKPGDSPSEVYRVKTQAPYVPTPVAHGDLMFLWYDAGIVTCIDSATGDVHWRQRIGGNFSGSPVRVGDAVYCIDEDGVVIVLAASKEFKELGRMPLGEASRSTPAISGGRMYLRTYSTLSSIGGKAS